MKDNIINFEARYYLNKQDEAHQKFEEKDFDGVIDVLKEPCEKIDKLLDTQIYCPQNIFESAICLNFLGKEVHQNNFSNINYYDFYLMMGAAYYNKGDKEKSKLYYDRAIILDPCSLFARVFEMKICIELNKYDDFLEKIQDALYFAYIRQDMGKVYNLAGDYLMHEKDFEMALVSYHLSLVYDMNDSIANKILSAANEANIDTKTKNFLAEDYMKKFYNTYKIPMMPNSKLIKLGKAMGEDSYKKGDYATSKFSYQIAYDLSFDESILPILDELKNKK